MKYSSRYYIISFIVLVAIDRFTKMWVMSAGYSLSRVTSWFAFTRTLNRGISFSLLSSSSEYYFIIVSLLVAALCIVLLRYTFRRFKEGYGIGAETVVMAGAFSNLLDRVWYGGVVDFIEISYRSLIWPPFNVADMLIVGGLCAMCIKGFYED